MLEAEGRKYNSCCLPKASKVHTSLLKSGNPPHNWLLNFSSLRLRAHRSFDGCGNAKGERQKPPLKLLSA
ncbi:hypothetical protein [Dendronalium sp. ChiSLP03b]|uniref:hypothetical protein n=1 Tax=Dendronalium sp. ChiSLP03b TaxID=3075381 RepID=UPI00391B8601